MEIRRRASDGQGNGPLLGELLRSDSFTYRQEALATLLRAREYLEDSARVMLPEIRLGIGEQVEEHIGIENGLLRIHTRPYKIEIGDKLRYDGLDREIAHAVVHVAQADRRIFVGAAEAALQGASMGLSRIATGKARPHRFPRRESLRAMMEGKAMLFAELFVTKEMTDREQRIRNVLAKLGGDAEYVPWILESLGGVNWLPNGHERRAGMYDPFYSHIFEGICDAFGIDEPGSQEEMRTVHQIGRHYVPRFMAIVSFAMEGFDAERARLRILKRPEASISKLSRLSMNGKKARELGWRMEDAMGDY